MSFLDKPVFGNLKLTRWTAIYLALMVFILLTRFWALGARGYEHDESIHAWESWKLATGQGYVHNPVYHGPFLYHLTALIFVLFGDNNTTARLGTARAESRTAKALSYWFTEVQPQGFQNALPL